MISIEELVQNARDNLADHIIANSSAYGDRWIHFSIELPTSPPYQSAICRHPLCGEKTRSYRISVLPGYVSGEKYSYTRADYYHLECFDELVDLTNPTHIDAFQPLTRTMCSYSIANENSILDFGAYRLVHEWKFQAKRIARPDLPVSTWLDEKRIDLLYNGGSTRYIDLDKNTDPMLYMAFSTVAAAVESDGPDDRDEWNFFNHYFPSSLGVLPASTSVSLLSEFLERWKWDRRIVRLPRGRVEKEVAFLESLSPKARRGITRLSVVPKSNIL